MIDQVLVYGTALRPSRCFMFTHHFSRCNDVASIDAYLLEKQSCLILSESSSKFTESW